MTHLRRLSVSSKIHGLMRMNRRVLFAAVLGIILFISVFALAPIDLTSELQFKLCLSVLLEVALVSLLLRLFGQQIMTSRNGILKWRCLFTLHSTAYALSWGLGCMHMIEALKMSTYSISVTTTALAACTVAVSTFAFDLVACGLFLFSLLVPILYAALFTVPDGAGLAGACTLSITFFLYLSYEIHRSEIDVLVQEVTIQAQAAELKKSNDLLQSSNELFEDTMKSIDEVFLTFGLDSICFGNPPERTASILGLNPVGSTLSEILRLSSAEGSKVDDWFKLLLTDRLDFEMLSSLGPAEWINPSSEKIYRIGYFPMRKGERLWGTIVTLNDVTSSKAAQRHADQADERAKFILAVSSYRKEFSEFTSKMFGLLDQLSDWRGSDLREVRQSLHSLKGTAGLFSILWLVREISKIEVGLKAEANLSVDEMNQTLRARAADLRDHFQRWFNKERETFDSLKVFEAEGIVVSNEYAEEIRSALINVPYERIADEFLRLLRASSVSSRLLPFRKVVADTAAKLNKSASFELIRVNQDARLLDDRYFSVFKAMVHVFTNAVDHGIEERAVRIQKGKAETGIITVRIFRDFVHEPSLVLQIDDDGAGLNLAKLKEAALVQGLDSATLNDFELAQTIFRMAISTKSEVTDISGHGIGLAALYEEVQRTGGSIVVSESDLGGLKFLIRLPAPPNLIWFEGDPRV